MDDAIEQGRLAGAVSVRHLAKKIAVKVSLAIPDKRPSLPEQRSATSVGRTNFTWRDDPDIGRIVNERLASPLPR